jgi:hypothetical protein
VLAAGVVLVVMNREYTVCPENAKVVPAEVTGPPSCNRSPRDPAPAGSAPRCA